MMMVRKDIRVLRNATEEQEDASGTYLPFFGGSAALTFLVPRNCSQGCQQEGSEGYRTNRGSPSLHGSFAPFVVFGLAFPSWWWKELWICVDLRRRGVAEKRTLVVEGALDLR